MGRFLAIVIALVAIALVINSFQSKDEPAEEEPVLVAPEKVEQPAGEAASAAPETEEAVTPPSTMEAEEPDLGRLEQTGEERTKGAFKTTTVRSVVRDPGGRSLRLSS